LGRKRYFVICIVMFTVCSFMCGAANSLGQPNQQSIILDTFPIAKRGAAFGVAAMATIVAPVLGPTLGGYITDTFDWRWSFYINAPIGIVAAIWVSVVVEDPP
jgi:DHA2 family multidrug resistance protein